MNPIFNALAAGYEEDEVLKHIIKAIPSMASKITRSKKNGISTGKILQYLSGRMDKEAIDGLQQSNKIDARRKKQQGDVVKSVLKEGAKLGTMAFGASVLAKAAPQILSKLPALTEMGLGAAATEGKVGQQVAKAATGAEAAGEVVEGAALAEGAVAEAAPVSADGIGGAQLTLNAEKEALKAAEAGLTDQDHLARRYLDKKKLSNRLRVLQKSGKSREEMVEFLKEKMPVTDQEYIRSIGFTGEFGNLDTRLGEMVDSYFPLDANKRRQQNQPEVAADPMVEESVSEIETPEGSLIEEQITQIPPLEEDEPPKPKLPKLGSDVITPDGSIAKILDIPGKTAKLEIDGKKSIVKSEDLEQSPISREELADLYDNLLRGIESHTGQDVSRNVNLAGYDAVNRELVYTPHSGTTYVYNDIDESDAQELTSLMPRKTSGENHIGAWGEGTESPIGAAISKLVIKLAKERGRGKEYSRKFESLYDAIKPARDASKEAAKARKKKKKNG